MPQEDWELSSGLRDDITFSIHLATFGFRANFNNGASLLLILVGTDENNEPFEHICSIGADWQAPDGKHAQHPSGKSRINRQSRYGQWIAACQEIPTLWSYLQNSVGPTDANIWENLMLHLSLKNVAWKIRGESMNRDILFPDAFIGFLQPGTPIAPSVPVPVGMSGLVGSTAGGPNVAFPLQQPMQPVIPTLAGPTPEQTLLLAQQAAGLTPPSPVRDQLRALALASLDHNTFVGQAFAIPGVAADPTLVKELMDVNDFYTKART